KFIDNHEANIDFPETVPETEDPDNLIVNGGFENEVTPSGVEVTFNYVEYLSFVNCQGFFDEWSRTTSPSLSQAAAVANNVWFERGTTQSQCRTQLDHLKSRTGTKSAFLWNIGGSTSNATTTSTGWYYHNLAQRVSLDDSKKFQFSFHALKENITVHSNENHLKDIYVGIVSSTDALPQTNHTFWEKITLPDNEDWNEISVVFDLPAIIEDNPGKSFKSCTIFIAIRTEWDGIKTLHSKVNIDDVRLVEIK
ncbi:MAG TPA: hypothetical protein DCG34_13200, partial [Clostridiales bacterium]|nr:hypothetical protein [Clostridiales bacterium]